MQSIPLRNEMDMTLCSIAGTNAGERTETYPIQDLHLDGIWFTPPVDTAVWMFHKGQICYLTAIHHTPTN